MSSASAPDVAASGTADGSVDADVKQVKQETKTGLSNNKESPPAEAEPDVAVSAASPKPDVAASQPDANEATSAPEAVKKKAKTGFFTPVPADKSQPWHDNNDKQNLASLGLLKQDGTPVDRIEAVATQAIDGVLQQQDVQHSEAILAGDTAKAKILTLTPSPSPTSMEEHNKQKAESASKKQLRDMEEDELFKDGLLPESNTPPNGYHPEPPKLSQVDSPVEMNYKRDFEPNENEESPSIHCHKTD